MTLHRSSNGKSIDMAGLMAKNKQVRAVGNMNVNANGDTLDSNNNVIDDSSHRVNRMYARTTQNPGAQNITVQRPMRPGQAPTSPSTASTTQQAPAQRVVQVPAPDVAPPPVIIEPTISEQEASEFDEFDAEEPVGKK